MAMTRTKHALAFACLASVLFVGLALAADDNKAAASAGCAATANNVSLHEQLINLSMLIDPSGKLSKAISELHPPHHSNDKSRAVSSEVSEPIKRSPDAEAEQKDVAAAARTAESMASGASKPVSITVVAPSTSANATTTAAPAPSEQAATTRALAASSPAAAAAANSSTAPAAITTPVSVVPKATEASNVTVNVFLQLVPDAKTEDIINNPDKAISTTTTTSTTTAQPDSAASASGSSNVTTAAPPTSTAAPVAVSPAAEPAPSATTIAQPAAPAPAASPGAARRRRRRSPQVVAIATGKPASAASAQATSTTSTTTTTTTTTSAPTTSTTTTTTSTAAPTRAPTSTTTTTTAAPITTSTTSTLAPASSAAPAPAPVAAPAPAAPAAAETSPPAKSSPAAVVEISAKDLPAPVEEKLAAAAPAPAPIDIVVNSSSAPVASTSAAALASAIENKPEVKAVPVEAAAAPVQAAALSSSSAAQTASDSAGMLTEDMKEIARAAQQQQRPRANLTDSQQPAGGANDSGQQQGPLAPLAQAQLTEPVFDCAQQEQPGQQNDKIATTDKYETTKVATISSTTTTVNSSNNNNSSSSILGQLEASATNMDNLNVIYDNDTALIEVPPTKQRPLPPVSTKISEFVNSDRPDKEEFERESYATCRLELLSADNGYKQGISSIVGRLNFWQPVDNRGAMHLLARFRYQQQQVKARNSSVEVGQSQRRRRKRESFRSPVERAPPADAVLLDERQRLFVDGERQRKLAAPHQIWLSDGGDDSSGSDASIQRPRRLLAEVRPTVVPTSQDNSSQDDNSPLAEPSATTATSLTAAAVMDFDVELLVSQFSLSGNKGIVGKQLVLSSPSGVNLASCRVHLSDTLPTSELDSGNAAGGQVQATREESGNTNNGNRPMSALSSASSALGRPSDKLDDLEEA